MHRILHNLLLMTEQMVALLFPKKLQSQQLGLLIVVPSNFDSSQFHDELPKWSFMQSL